MHANFFKNDKPRLQNPTFVSNHVHSTMLFPGAEYWMKRSDMPQYQKVQEKHTKEQPIKIMSEAPNMPNHRRSQSNLSNYGTTSLGKLPSISDREVFENQQKKYNIITMADSPYKQSIKMFPKFRNQIKNDGPNQARQAFISGKPQLILKSKLNPEN